MHSVVELKERLERYGFNFSKSKGQNFLIDPNIPEKIVRQSGLLKTQGVLEIGPGAGALTRCLSAAAARVAAVELDGRLIEPLREMFCDCDNVEIIRGDILKLDLKSFVSEHLAGYDCAVCANLPYNITTPVLTSLIESRMFSAMTVMVQREVAHRLCAEPGTAEYGAITVFVNYHTEPSILFDVPPECFIPRPRVKSCVIKLTRRCELKLHGSAERMFFKAVRAVFSARRKTLVNSLFGAFGAELTKPEILELVTGLGHRADVRGETLDIDGFAAVSGALSRLIFKND